jgi:hypothetical protein
MLDHGGATVAPGSDDGGLTLVAFAEARAISKDAARRLVRSGQVPAHLVPSRRGPAWCIHPDGLTTDGDPGATVAPPLRLVELDEIPPLERAGAVYVLRADNGLVKIGCSRDVVSRVRALQTMSPVPIQLVHVFEHDQYRALESALHRQYHHRRRQGEWFELDDDELRALIEDGPPELILTESVDADPEPEPSSTLTAEALATLVQATLTPIIAPLVAELAASRQTAERQAERIAQLERENGALSERVKTALAPESPTAGHTGTIVQDPTPQSRMWASKPLILALFAGAAALAIVAVFVWGR